MPQTTCLEFRCNFEAFLDRTQQEPVEITRDRRREWVLMSAEHYDWLIAAAHRTHRTAEAADAVAAAVRRAEVDPDHGHLDASLR